MASAPPPPPTNPAYEPPPPYDQNNNGKPLYPPTPSQTTYSGQPSYGAQPMMPGYSQPPTTIITQPAPVQTVIVQAVGFGPDPVSTHCPHCAQPVVSKIHYETGLLTWLIFGALLFFGCWCGCCLIPFCVDGCRDVRHSCPNCRATLGHFRRL